ncbi:MAG: hypothetical protein DIZ78_09465 [endosymbiont of Escarpia spicata]|uniref:Uncharacterized protein n=1 Tax=endosymbiont of Escarpia spicata TaxID=2200908 RepID=A0A370DQ07_9GAMM|nr:MAG: hypothetical protein DIZ78_09465 [endosymbiont of Escarpia spicata]
MEQEQFWYDSAEEAVNAAILKSGKKPKAVAVELWPHMKMDSAYARLKNSLRDDKDEKLTLDEIIHICRVTASYDPLYYMAEELSHSRPQFRAPNDQEADLAHAAQSQPKERRRLPSA